VNELVELEDEDEMVRAEVEPEAEELELVPLLLMNHHRHLRRHEN
jgi:hypothetical protein